MPLIGSTYQQQLECRSAEVAAATYGMTDPDVSIVIRARNERERLEGLFQDIAAQQFAGNVQLLVVDSGSKDGTREMAQDYGAQIVPIDQATFSHPKALNAGFEAADHDWVLSLVAHSNLTTTLALAGITRWSYTAGVGGIYGPAMLPDAYATPSEKVLATAMGFHRRLGPAGVLTKLENGAMVTHRAALSKSVWRALGGFDLRYGAGGEDKDMARRMFAAGIQLAREPVLSIYHSHGTNVIGTVRQALAYRRMRNKAEPLDVDRLAYRSSLRLHEE